MYLYAVRSSNLQFKFDVLLFISWLAISCFLIISKFRVPWLISYSDALIMKATVKSAQSCYYTVSCVQIWIKKYKWYYEQWNKRTEQRYKCILWLFDLHEYWTAKRRISMILLRGVFKYRNTCHPLCFIALRW